MNYFLIASGENKVKENNNLETLPWIILSDRKDPFKYKNEEWGRRDRRGFRSLALHVANLYSQMSTAKMIPEPTAKIRPEHFQVWSPLKSKTNWSGII